LPADYAADGDREAHRTPIAESAAGAVQILNGQRDTIRVEAPGPALVAAAWDGFQ
jgi:hypothetical protein